MRRRHYLASAAALLAGPLAGCAHPDAVLRMDAVTDIDIAERASRDVDRDQEARGIVADAVEDGSATATGRRPPLDDEEPVAYGGRYYDLEVTETGEGERTEYEITIDYDPPVTPSGEVVRYDDLPDVDREALEHLLPPPAEPPDNDGPDRGVTRPYSAAAAERSVLVPEAEYDAVEYEAERYPVRSGDGRTVTTYEYRYEAEEIAADADEYGAWVRESHAFTLWGLSAAEREIVAEAVDGGYYESDAEDAFASLAKRFREHRGYETDDWGGIWLVRYEETVYWVDLRHPPSAVEG